jgi:division protein CdvB (Snf7/Vps24/ESCRT-III family)
MAHLLIIGNDKVWDVVEDEFVIIDHTNLTDNDKINKQCNNMALNTIYNGIDSKVFEQIKDLEKASEVWVGLEETCEGTSTVKSAKLYMLKDKLSNFKMKNDVSILEMFYRLQVIINNLKSLGEKVKDEDSSHKFLMCLPKSFKTLRTIIFRGELKDVTPNEVLDDVMTEDQYNSDGEELVKEEDKKKKSVAFKAGTSSSKNKSEGKTKKEESSDEECSYDDSDDEALALFVHKFGKMMKKKVYDTRKRRDHFKNKEYMRLCYKCKSPNHVVADCPYNSDNEDNEKKNKKEKMTFKKKKKGGSYVIMWDSDASTDDDSSDDDKASKKKALASIATNNKPSLFDTPSCFIAKGSKVKYGESENDDSKSENKSENNSDDDEFSNEQLVNKLEQADSIINKKSKKCKELQKKLHALKQSFDELNATHERLVEAHEKLGKAHTKLEKAHSLLLEQDKERVIVSCDVGVTCDIIEESFYEPIAVAPYWHFLAPLLKIELILLLAMTLEMVR